MFKKPRNETRFGHKGKTPAQKIALDFSNFENLAGRQMPPVAIANYKALLARPCTQLDYIPRAVKVQNALYSFLHMNYPYFGPVDVKISDHPGIQMLLLGDDSVARVCFFFGQDSFEPFSIFLFSQLSRNVDNILDIGAFTGIFGLAAARANPSSSVICVEPLPNLAERIEVNAGLNGLDNISVINSAASNTDGEATLIVYGGSYATSGASLCERKTREKINDKIVVNTLSFPSLVSGVNGRIGLIKIDVEGAEVMVLESAKAILEKHQPVIVSEVLTNEAVIDQISALPSGYTVYFVNEFRRTLVPIDAGFDLPKYGYGNIICVSREEDHRFIETAAKQFASYPFEAKTPTKEEFGFS